MISGWILKEPRDQVYRDLIAACTALGDRALLVIRAGAGESPEGRKVLEQLDPWLILSELRPRWPGTQLVRSTALVHEYKVGADVVSILQSSVSGLYEWCTPFPEDLAFMRADGSEILYSVGHEEQGALSLYPSERETLIVKCPAIAGYVEWDLQERPGA